MLHSHSLFHFTDKKGLLGILERNFLPKFSEESIQINDQMYKTWIPMCCFCDIPLSQVSNHLDVYGNYGIGLNPEWVKEKKLNPVNYVITDSVYYKNLTAMEAYLYKTNHEVSKTTDNLKWISSAINASNFISSFVKPYYGIDSNKGHERCFYDEREWRYIPEAILTDISIISNIEFENEIFKDKYNKLYEKYALEFEPKDITYIVIEKENERLEMIRNIERFKSKYPELPHMFNTQPSKPCFMTG